MQLLRMARMSTVIYYVVNDILDIID